MTDLSNPRWIKLKGLWFLLLGLAGFVLLAGWALLCRPGHVPPPEPLPTPNGYADFVRAGTLVAENSGDYSTLPLPALRALVATHAAALRLVRAGLAKACRMPPYFLNATNSQHLDEVATFKRLAQAFSAECRLARLESRIPDAQAAALDCCHFGQKATTGGVMIDALVGLAIEAIGLARLSELQNDLDAKCARQAAQALEALEARQESLDTIFARERRWMRAGRFGEAGLLQQLMAAFTNRPADARIRLKAQRVARELRQTMLDCAARAYELDRGKRPATADALVPDYLKAVPLDPATGQPMTLRQLPPGA